MRKARKEQKQTPTADYYNELLSAIRMLVRMFQEVAKRTPEMFWWSITVSEDITVSGGIDVTLNRWAELLQDNYTEELCSLGGVGNRNRDEWTLYAVAGEGVTLEDYKKVADVCASTVKALWIPEHPKVKLTISESYGGFIKHVRPARYKKFVNMRGSALGSLWITEKPKVKLNVSEYLDGFVIGRDDSSDIGSSSYMKDYWVPSWFEFIFNTAQERNCPIRVDSGSQYTKDWEIAEIPFRYIDHSICEASILALEFLRAKVKALIQPQPQQPAETEQKEIVEVKPGLFGITVNIKELARRFWKRVCYRSKD